MAASDPVPSPSARPAVADLDYESDRARCLCSLLQRSLNGRSVIAELRNRGLRREAIGDPGPLIAASQIEWRAEGSPARRNRR